MAVQEMLTSSLWSQQLLLSVVVVLVFCGFAIKIYTGYIKPYKRLTNSGLKMPIPKPFIGNMLDYDSSSQHLAQVERQKLYGNVYGNFTFYAPTVWVGDPELLKVVMVKGFSNFTDRYTLAKLMKPLDKTLLQLKDKDWKRVRTIVVPTFSASKLKLVLPHVKTFSDNLVSTLTKAEAEHQSIDVRQPYGHFTMQVILATAFGIHFESPEHEAKIIKAAGTLFRDVSTSAQLVVIYASWMFKIFEPIIGGGIMTSIKTLTDVVQNIIKQRRKNLKEGIPCRKDILQHMIEAGDGDNLNDEEIVAQAMIFLIAGYETTANTLSFVSYSLATNPEVQRKLMEEIDDTCPDDASLDYEILSKLTYLEMVLAETLRMYPPGFVFNRRVQQDININGIDIPKDAMIGLPIYGVHHNPQYWPDPERFIPERFTPEAKAKQHPFSYIPFGGGPRNCVGMRLALMEVKLALVKILQSIEFLTVKETEIPLQLKSGATLSPANGVYVGIRKRYL